MWKSLQIVVFILVTYNRVQAEYCVCVENVGNYLNIRSCRSTYCGIVGRGHAGACFKYLGARGNWVSIQYGSTTAYAHKGYLSDHCDTPCHCVTATALNFRSCASTACSILGVEHNGACFEHVGNSGIWRKMKYNAGTAFAHGSYLTAVETCQGYGTCFGVLCSGNPTNEIRGCDPQGCGRYGASRGGASHRGADVKCTVNRTIYAPITGTLTRSRPYGNGKCCDDGFRIYGTGAWQGYVVKVWYNHPYSNLIGQQVTRRQAVGTHAGLECCYGTSMTDHAHIEATVRGRIINPEPLLNCV